LFTLTIGFNGRFQGETNELGVVASFKTKESISSDKLSIINFLTNINNQD